MANLRWLPAGVGALTLALLLLTMGACLQKPGANGEVAAGDSAFDPARASLAVAYGTMMEGANTLTQRSPSDELQAAMKQVLDLERRYGDLVDRNALEQARLEALRAQVQRLNAAAELSRIQGDWERMMAKLRPNVKNPQAEREKLRERDEAFLELDDKRIAAERAYRDAITKLEMARMAVERTVQEESSKVIRNGAI